MTIPADVQPYLQLLEIAMIVFAIWWVNHQTAKHKVAIKTLEDESTANKTNYEFVLKAARDATDQVKTLTTQITDNFGQISALKAENEIIKAQRERDRRDRNETAEQLNQLKGQFEQSAKENTRLFEDNRRLSEQKIEVAVANSKLLSQNEILVAEKAAVVKENETILKQNEGYRADMRGALEKIKTLEEDLAQRPTREEFEKAMERLKFLEAQHDEYNRLSTEVLKAYADNKRLQITVEQLQLSNVTLSERNKELDELLKAINKYNEELIGTLTSANVTVPPAPVATALPKTETVAPIAPSAG